MIYLIRSPCQVQDISQIKVIYTSRSLVSDGQHQVISQIKAIHTLVKTIQERPAQTKSGCCWFWVGNLEEKNCLRGCGLMPAKHAGMLVDLFVEKSLVCLHRHLDIHVPIWKKDKLNILHKNNFMSTVS